MPKSPVKEKSLGNRIESEKTLSNGKLAEIMPQPWSPQSKINFPDLLAREKPPKFLFHEPNSL